MDNYRLILSICLALLSMAIWETWQSDYVKKHNSNSGGVASIRDGIPHNQLEGAGVPKVSTDNLAVSNAESSGEIVKINTDVLTIEIDASNGAIIRNAWLNNYANSADDVANNFKILSSDFSHLHQVQLGLISDTKELAPTHKSKFTSKNSFYRMGPDDSEIVVPFEWRSSDSTILVEKRFVFKRNSYVIRVEQHVTNSGTIPWKGREYRQIIRSTPKDTSHGMIYTYTGGAVYSKENKYEKFDFEAIAQQKLDKDISGGWLSMVQHYFITALIPEESESLHYYSNRTSSDQYIIGMYGQDQIAQPGYNTTFNGKIWVGPKLQDELEKTASGLELTTDYGWLTIFAKPLFWILNSINQFIGNWGWSIVILTILIKLAFYRLSAASYKSMAAMRKVSPKLQAIKERYGEDKEKYNKAMMELYQKEKINPVGGCLPILVQMPVFIALYWVLLESVELRDAPFVLWIKSLSANDPYFVLPILMGISMIIQQKLNPAPPDPMQAKVMMVLPFIFTAMFAFFPAGLVLYWVVNNILSILQQWRITQVVERSEKYGTQ